ncbi:MAG: ABC transporter permease subunit [Candidatus Izemoplasmatales bacterium]|nr:ABC transporter permease subunit [Candidatus Izemoplasmatales bacterium]
MFDSVLFALEFRRSQKSLWIWTLAIAATMVMVILLYPMVKDMYSAIPPEYEDFLAAFGGLPNNILEYYATEGAMMLQLFGGMYAAIEGYGAINRDDREKTVETLFTLPRRREQVFATKLLRALTNITIFSLVNYVLSVLSFVILKESIDQGIFLAFNALNLLMYVIIAVLTFSIAGISKATPKNGIAIAVPIVMYILFVFSSMTNNEWLEKLQYLTPFTFADPVVLIKEGGSVEGISLLVYGALSLGLLTLAYFRFQKREFTI